MDLLEQFIKNSKQQHLFTKKDRLLVAVSGGVDSVVLCHLCKLAGFEFGIAHCNFQLRGEDSLRDEVFVKEMAAKLAVPFYNIRFNTTTFAAENKLSTQEAARVLRYEWFEEIRQEQGYDYLLTAHHADDNVETVLMSFFRGTGINGLTGIKEKNGYILRPLLFAKREALELFVTEQNLSFVQDVSNFTDDYTRNFFRNSLLPQIAKVYPEVRGNLVANIRRMSEAHTLYQQAVAAHKKKLLTPKGNEFLIPVLLLLKSEPVYTILFEIIKKFGFKTTQVAEVLALTGSESGHYVQSASHKIVKDRRYLVITPVVPLEDTRTIIEDTGLYQFGDCTLLLEYKKADTFKITNDANVALLDAAKIEYPIVLRRWKAGDYFYPLGMTKKKKVSKFLIDTKVSRPDKEKVWVLEMNRKIIWIVGHRIDHRFRIEDTEANALKISVRQKTVD